MTTNLLDVDRIAQVHNECIDYFLRHLKPKPTVRDIERAAADFYSTNTGEKLNKAQSKWLSMKVASIDVHRLTIHEMGLSSGLRDYLARVRQAMGASLHPSEVTTAQKLNRKSFAKLDAFDQWLADAYFATLAASSVVWTTASGSGVIAYAGSGPDGSHHYTDWGKVITADATAAVGELAAWGLSAAAGLAAPPVGGAAAAILAIAAAIASFLYWLSGDATVIIERDPGAGTPGGGGEERPPVV